MKDEGRKGRASPWGEVASRSDDGEGFTIRKHKDSRPLSVALRAPAPPEGSLSLHPEQIQNLQSYELCGILDIEKIKSFRKPLLTPQSVGVVFFLLRTIQNLQSYEFCGILDIEKTTAHRGGLPSLVKKNPLRARQSQGAVFLCPYAFTFCSEI